MAQTPILTVTLNPALDLSARVDHMVAGPKLRMTNPLVEAGGGGVNVARAIVALGGTALAWVALGGASGAQHRQLLQREVTVAAFEIKAETRQNWAISDRDGQQYRLQLAGPDWPEALAQTALDDILRHAGGDGFVVLSGSQPPGLSADFAMILAKALGQAQGAGRLIVDTSGQALTQLVTQPQVDAPVFLLRLDQAEAAAVAGHPLPDPLKALDLAQSLITRGVAQHVCIALGADGSVLAGQGAAWHCRPPVVPVRSKVGAGDSFTGAFTLALAQGQPLEGALQHGTAAAAAAVMTEGTALCRRADVARIAPQCETRPLLP